MNCGVSSCGLSALTSATFPNRPSMLRWSSCLSGNSWWTRLNIYTTEELEQQHTATITGRFGGALLIERRLHWSSCWHDTGLWDCDTISGKVLFFNTIIQYESSVVLQLENFSRGQVELEGGRSQTLCVHVGCTTHSFNFVSISQIISFLFVMSKISIFLPPILK